MYTAHYPRLHPSDFKVKTLDGVADDWPIDYETLEPFFAENDRMTGVSGLAGDPAYPSTQPPMPPMPLGKSGQRFGRAMNKLGWHWWPSDTADRHGRLRRPRPLHQSRPLHAGLRAGRQGQHRHHLLAGGAARRRRAAHPLPACARSPSTSNGMATGVDLLRREGRGAVPAGRDGDRGLQRRRHAAPAAELAVGQVPQRHRQLERPGRQEPDVPSLCLHLRLCRRAAGRQPRPAALPVEPRILRDRQGARLRARLHLPVRPRHRLDRRGDHQHRRRPPAVGRGPSQGLSRPAQPPHRPRRRSARTCRRSTTA